jgi:hypothetical protein
MDKFTAPLKYHGKTKFIIPIFRIGGFTRPHPSFMNGTVEHNPWLLHDQWRNRNYFQGRHIPFLNLNAKYLGYVFWGMPLAIPPFILYVLYDNWYETQGPGRAEREYWENYLHEKQQSHHH